MRMAIVIWWWWSVIAISAAEPVTLRVDFSRTNGVLRPLHGLNKGPLAPGGLIDVTAAHRQIGVPSTRLHDCHWPNPDVVDIHAVFPNFDADPARLESYDFTRTDEYVAAVRATGADIVYRLGESIEHTTTKRFVHPPRSAEHWAAICLGIIRHYNEGWANGFRHGIRSWEIWNEPENRPVMWTGTDEQFLDLYRTAARAIKARYPELKVGGPGFGYCGKFVNDSFEPSPFAKRFLTLCRDEHLPLDFFSWHCYAADPAELSTRARAIRQLLNQHGFTQTESHLNEWNFLPDNDWQPIGKTGSPTARQRHYGRMAGAEGAAFIATALIELQDAPVDVCNFFHGEIGAFGLFDEHGVPQKNYQVLRAFRELLDSPRRVSAGGGTPGQLAIAAGVNARQDRTAILVANYRHASGTVQLHLESLPWRGLSMLEVRGLNAARDWTLEKVQRGVEATTWLSLPMAAPSVALIVIQPDSTETK